MMFGRAAIIDEQNRPLNDVPHMPGYNNIPDTTDFNSFVREMKVCNHLPSKPAIRWEYFTIGGMPTMVDGERVTCVDWLLALNALHAIKSSKSVIQGYVDMPQTTSYYRVRSGQMSVADIENGAWERERTCLVEGSFDPLRPTGLTLQDYRILGWAPSRDVLRQLMEVEP
jgi:hypothetical protein